MKINIKKLSIPTVLFLLLSTSYAAEDGYYVPIHNLTPITYNPLTTNYNPDYDNYNWLMPVQVSQQTNSVSVSISACDEVKRLDQQWRDRASTMWNGSFTNMFQQAALGNQDRQMMRVAQQNCTNANQLASANLQQQNQLGLQDLMSQRNPGGSGGCGSRGGPGYRKANGQCASWSE